MENFKWKVLIEGFGYLMLIIWGDCIFLVMVIFIEKELEFEYEVLLDILCIGDYCVVIKVWEF